MKERENFANDFKELLILKKELKRKLPRQRVISWKEILKLKKKGLLVEEIEKIKEIRNRLIVANLGLIGKAIDEFFSEMKMSWEDMFQEGIEGLSEAIDRFDPERGICFSTYAIYWIRKKIQLAIQQKARLIRVPVYMLKNVSFSIVSLYDVDGFNKVMLLEEIPSTEFPSPFQVVYQRELRENLERIFKLKLSPREREVIRKKFGLEGRELNLREIGEEIGISREAARLLEKNALKKLARHLKWVKNFLKTDF